MLILGKMNKTLQARDDPSLELCMIVAMSTISLCSRRHGSVVASSWFGEPTRVEKFGAMVSFGLAVVFAGDFCF